MPKKTLPQDQLPYDDSDSESIIRYAGRLTNHTLREVLNLETDIIGGTNAKGRFGQIVEKDYFYIENNNDATPDFNQAGIELKVTPMVMGKGGKLRSKERLVLGIIDYNEVPKKGFDIFLDKNSHLLIIFYLWTANTDIREYRILKVVDWTPSDETLRIIREDWDVIQGFVERGEAHLLSERYTRYLAANTKGVGHGKDYRTQPYSDEPAKQRSLSFKNSFMNILYETTPDVNDMLPESSRDYGSVFHGEWSPECSFTDYVLNKFNRLIGKTCREIESELMIDLDESSKQYYSVLAMAMFGVVGKKYVKEFEEANIKMKIIRLKNNGTPKESMSLPAFNPDEIVEQTWESSDLYRQLDCEFLFPVFEFRTSHPDNEARKDLVFKGAFFWCIPEKDLKVVETVWTDTRNKIIGGRRDFVKLSDRTISHVRPHDKKKVFDKDGRDITKMSFWLNALYLKDVVNEKLPKR